ncbi:hypothetical protein N7466_001892 [Penicillium verhagenii]|uniref:uncharacterized protein n=1 Tax=Penicillium verhagenii TaxID=1562060 RepID=UPI0025452A68|nr:uncharacterized protein N7466_001892 [Penicillium verhagenii]KAJ5938758.1 hypothetical protein N7466_001892 [Penicillium verhagenii]
MPHPNRFPSSPGLRDPPKQALDELLLPRSHSMSHPKSSLSHSSVRSFSTRRPRPSVASIADLFVGSLVLAGLCHEHSPRPRGRGLSTLHLRTSEPNLRRFRSKEGPERGERPARRHWEFSGSSAQQSRQKSWLCHNLEIVEEDNLETHNLSIQAKERLKEDNDHALPRLPYIPDSKSQQYFEEHFFDTIPEVRQLKVYPKEDTIDDERSSAIATDLNITEDPSLTRDERVRNAVSGIFQRLLGDKYDWEEAVEAIMPKQVFIQKADDNTRDAIESPSVARLVEALPSQEQATTQFLFRLYRDLPEPGVAHLSKASRGRLLRRLATPPDRRWSDARRYLALVEDMITAGLPMSRSLWSTAIHMAGRSNNGRVSKRRLVHAIGLWQQMEHVAGIKADDVVFNILFDIAIKANQFVVADRLEEEMNRRGLHFSRSGLVSKIFACGMRKDLDGIRGTFDYFVKSGELVDTVVLNCVMASFLRAGDVETAEQLYGRMLNAQVQQKKKESSGPGVSQETSPSLSPDFTFYRAKTRELGRLLKKSKALKKSLPACHQALQDSLPMTPDTRTFYIWLQFCTRVTGDLDMFMNVLRDMENTFSVPPRHLIYLYLFEGFGLHGRRRKNWWTAEKLRLTWLSFIQAVRDSKARHSGFHEDAPAMIWENPLTGVDVEAEIPTVHPSANPDELYMSLPSTDGDASSITPEENPNLSNRHTEDQVIDLDEDDIQGEDQLEHEDTTEGQPDNDLADLNFDVESIFTPQSLSLHQEGDPDRQDLEYISQRLENGVFVGRRMIILILRAFGTCCGPQEVMEAWLQLEQLWSPHKRKANDVLAVKEAIDEQMSRNPR